MRTHRKASGGAAMVFLLMLGATTGCYKWTPFELAAAPVSLLDAEGVRVDTTTASPGTWRIVLARHVITPAPAIGTLSDLNPGANLKDTTFHVARVTRMNGAMVELEDVTLSDWGVRGTQRKPQSGGQLEIPRPDIQRLEVRELDPKGMLLLGGGVVGAGIAALLVTGGDDGPGDYTPPE